MGSPARDGEQRVQIGNGLNLFDFVYVDNLVDAHILAAHVLLREHAEATTQPASQKVAGEAFFITNDEPYRFWGFARAIGRVGGHPTYEAAVWSIPRRVGLFLGTFSEWFIWATSLGTRKPVMTRNGIKFSCMTRTFSVEKAKRRLGYRPAVSMEIGIQRAGEWFSSQAGGNKKRD